MSIFKVKQWWSNEKSQSVDTEGTQNGTCLKVDKFKYHSVSDCIVVGEGSLIKIYKPNNDETANQSILEKQLNGDVLQIETGKFVADSEDRHILVLHPQSYEIYQLHKKEGHTDAGDQNILKTVIKHTFTKKAHSVSCGPFGNIKSRDFICVQSLDGSLSFFDQETFLFTYISNDDIIPGPVSYIASSDSFVISKSTWVMEIRSYQQLREFSDVNVRQNKKDIPQWSYNAGEEISSVQVIQTSSNFSSIIALGERHLCCFQDNGLMKFMIKLNFMPICFNAYLIGWYYEPGARLLVMVASEDSKLYIYEGTTLLWSCDLLHNVISISRCFLQSLPGGLVTLSTKGVVCVSYLGTEPDLNANAAFMINDATDPENIIKELENVEEELQKILEGKEDADNGYSLDQILQIKADVGKPIQNLFQQFDQDDDASLHLQMCPVVVILTCEDPKQIESVQITYVCRPPFACSESTICLDSVNGTEIIETQVYLGNEADISETRVKILFTVIDSSGKINELIREVLLPLSLFCLPSDTVAENELKLNIQTNHSCIDFADIFTDFSKEELRKYGNIHNDITFRYRATKKTVKLTANANQYSVEANDISDMTSVLDHLIINLMDHYVRMNVKNFNFSIKLDDEFTKHTIHRFLKSIEAHAKERTKLKSYEDELNVLQRQFTLVQKRLLVQYGSLPPGDCDPLEFLMKDTHKRIVQSTHQIIHCREAVSRAGNTLMAIGHFVIYIFKQSVSDDFKVKLIEEMLTLSSLYEDYQEWEEAVTQALPYIMNNVFKKSEKDKEKLAAVTEQGILSHVNLKRFLKQIRMILDKMFSEARGVDDKVPHKEQNRVTRIEEFVEVI